ncbi:MAG: 16S rRNA (adenine(1518)-N(6)/adenine(1519)-N(6))-dimethyltransferase RsmA [Candidatus Gracilibacteria bacterium]|nr:16S rRNA (adenine(1518)-N(6)/adenine(1519)-N(6))-dimethyltransferase RsmA [Candidatus Gracilibacteria bacterium]
MQKIIEKYNIKAKKSLGQNFLLDEYILNSICEITNITGENIIEIGPGFGALTGKILERKPQNLTLIELDNFMIEIINDRIKNDDLDVGQTNLEIINKDVLKFETILKNYKLIANIPYYITSPILYKFLYEVQNKPNEMIILMQKEVGERIISKKSSVLSLFIQKKCLASEKVFVPKNCFFPQPKIDSTVLFLQIFDKYDFLDDNLFLTFIKSSFSNPRKKMINNLSNAGYNKEKMFKKLLELGFNENTRAEELNIDNYIYLIS